MKYFKPESSVKWKKGDEVVCIQNAGHTSHLTINKTYTVIKQVREYRSDSIYIICDTGSEINVFCSRFTTLKLERKNKLQKIKQSI
jgi:mevalonate pyrophosphate decarboxylase